MAQLMKPCKDHPRLRELLAKVKDMPPMTREQIRTQRRSWVIGELMLEDPNLTREEAERRVLAAEARGGY